MRYLPGLVLLFVFGASCCFGQDTVVSGPGMETELWEGKALTARFRVGVCYKPDGSARGVLLLKHRNGDQDTYHLYGTLKNNEFYLTHSSGHVISGRLAGPDAMEGKAKLSSGLRLSLSGKRTRNVPLIAADCAPLPQ